MNRFGRGMAGLGIGALVALHAGVVPAQTSTYSFDLPAQSLADSLRAIGRQTNTNVMFEPRLVKNLRAPALRAETTRSEAIRILLERTQLSSVQTSPGSILIEARRPAAEDTTRPHEGAHTGALQDGERQQTGRIRLAQAQDDSNAIATAAPAAEQRVQIDEVIVTATKRRESVYDVPASITAIDSAEIESRGLKGMGDYLSAVPGVSFIDADPLHSGIIIRGISTSVLYQNLGAGATVATYFGETPTTNAGGLEAYSGLDLKLVDIERIEVLRGPQGTAFGNSSLGGAVRTIPAAPKLDRMGGKVAADYSYTGHDGSANHMIQGVLNLPIVPDRLALRAVGYRYDNSGFYKNLAGSDPTLQAYAASLGPQALSLARDADDRGADEQVGGRLALLWQVTDDLQIKLSYLQQELEQEGFSYSKGDGDGFGYTAFRTRSAAFLSLPVSDGHEAGVDRIVDSEISITNATLEYDLRWADLVTSASWTDSEAMGGVGGGLDSPNDYVFRGPHDAFAGEVRVVSKLTGPLQFLVGFYHEKLEDSLREVYSSLEIPSRNPYGDGVNEVLGVFETSRELTQDAVFGEISYDLRDNLTLSLGGRYYEFDKDNGLETSGWFTGAPLDSPDVSEQSLSQSGNNFKASLRYEPLENLMLYATWSEGFRLGRPASGLIPAICDTDSDGLLDGTDITIASTRVIDSDTLDNFELGGKFSLLDGRWVLDTSVYRINWKGLPTSAVAECSEGRTLFYVANAGEAVSQGFEVQSKFQLTRGLRVDFGGSYTNAELSKDAPGLDALDGDRLPDSPKWIANLGLQYDFNVMGYPAFVRADSSYRGTFYGDLARTPLTKAGGYVRADARIGIVVNRVNVEVFGNNLTDADDYLWRQQATVDTAFGYIMRPRTIGLQLGYDF